MPNQQKSALRKSFAINDLQVVERDFAFLVDKEMAIGDIIKTIAGTDKNLIKEVSIFDIYSDKKLDEAKKSVALRVKIQPIDKTLTSEEIDVISQKIIETSLKTHNAVLRQS